MHASDTRDLRPDDVSLHAASPADETLVSNLLQLYIHDLSALFPNVTLGPDGRFEYPALSRYWSEPDRRFAFVIRVHGNAAGFALVTRGSPAADDPDVLDVAEFFVLRRFRGTGVGRLAAELLFQRLPGRWTVRVAEANTQGIAFWQRVLEALPARRATSETRPGRSSSWRVYAFDSSS